MAVRFDAADDRISYTATLPDPTSGGITVLGWWRIRVDRNEYSTYCRISSSGGANTVGTFASNPDGLGVTYYTAGGSVTVGYSGVVDEWFGAAFVVNGTTCTVYARPEGGATTTTSGTVSSSVPNHFCVGGRAVADPIEWFNGDAAYVRMYSGLLTQAQIESEWNSSEAVLKTGLFGDWPLTEASNLNDISGNGRHLTAGSTPVSSETGPGMGSVGARFLSAS